MIGQGYEYKEVIKTVGMLGEGINVISDAMEMVEEYDLKMLIVMVVDAIINRGTDSKNIVNELMEEIEKHNFPSLYMGFEF